MLLNISYWRFNKVNNKVSQFRILSVFNIVKSPKCPWCLDGKSMLPVSFPCNPAVKAVSAHIVPGTRHVHIDSSCTLRINYARKLTDNGRELRGRWHDGDWADIFHTFQIGRRLTSHFGFEVDTEARSVAAVGPPLLISALNAKVPKSRVSELTGVSFQIDQMSCSRKIKAAKIGFDVFWNSCYSPIDSAVVSSIAPVPSLPQG